MTIRERGSGRALGKASPAIDLATSPVSTAIAGVAAIAGQTTKPRTNAITRMSTVIPMRPALCPASAASESSSSRSGSISRSRLMAIRYPEGRRWNLGPKARLRLVPLGSGREALGWHSRAFRAAGCDPVPTQRGSPARDRLLGSSLWMKGTWLPHLQAAANSFEGRDPTLPEARGHPAERRFPHTGTLPNGTTDRFRSRATRGDRGMREARALPGPPARALSDDPRLWARAADPKPILSRSQAPPHLPRADTEQTAMNAQSHPSG